MKESADNNFKFDKNVRKLPKSVENTVGKGEISRDEQFLFSSSVFKRLVLQTRKNQGLFGKGLKSMLGKGENAGKQNNLTFQQCFLSFTRGISFFV